MVTPKAMPAKSKDTALRMILMIAACFAIGAVGVFVAILLQHDNASSSAATGTSTQQLNSDQAKAAALRSLEASNAAADSASSTGGSPSIGTDANTPAVKPTPVQADPSDANAAAKLKILEGLNSH
jgi:hypothetical protein